MKTDKYKTDVKFLVNTKDENKDVIAFFPKDFYNKELYGKNMRTCYAHVGQHSACHIDYAKESRPATKEERESLVKELESIGYNLNITN